MWLSLVNSGFVLVHMGFSNLDPFNVYRETETYAGAWTKEDERKRAIRHTHHVPTPVTLAVATNFPSPQGFLKRRVSAVGLFVMNWKFGHLLVK